MSDIFPREEKIIAIPTSNISYYNTSDILVDPSSPISRVKESYVELFHDNFLRILYESALFPKIFAERQPPVLETTDRDF